MLADSTKQNMALVMPMLSGKTTLLGSLSTDRSDLQRRLGKVLLDSDVLADHEALIRRHGQPKRLWDDRQWARWNQARRVSIARALRHHRGALVLVHTCDWADLLLLKIAAVVWTPSRAFAARIALHPDRAALAQMNRHLLRQEIKERWPDRQLQASRVHPSGLDALYALTQGHEGEKTE